MFFFFKYYNLGDFYEKYPKKYESKALAIKEIVNFLEMLNNKGIIKLMNYG